MARALVMSTPAATKNWRNARSWPPTPPSEVQVKLAVSLFAASTASLMVLKGESGWTMNISGVVVVIATKVRSNTL